MRRLLRKEIKLSKRYRKGLMQKPNVVGVGVGYQEKKRRSTGREAIVVFVEKKIPAGELAENDMVPRSLSGNTVDVIETEKIRFLEEDDELPGEPGGKGYPRDMEIFENRKERYRPAPGGCSIGHYQVTAGTMGAVVLDQETGCRLILSNNHVMANSSSGQDDRARPGDSILQPGAYDGGEIPDDILGNLERFVPLQRTFQETRCLTAKSWEKAGNKLLTLFLPHYRLFFQRYNDKGNLVDAALAKPLHDEDISEEILFLGKPKSSAAVKPGQTIAFSGRTSGVSRGKVIAVEVSLNISLGEKEQVYFVDQLLTSALSRPGDSGSLLMDDDNHAVGLLFAGSDRVSVSNSIDHVCRLLNVSIASW